ncbi:S8 family peptidase [Myroides injenensis]|uniref:S8 family peptidase n=1 Tax=Myroides injenensis TaxID=1183151 RepID=UPI000289AC64|nr:S8 family peptidase [Myroides injenensis]
MKISKVTHALLLTLAIFSQSTLGQTLEVKNRVLREYNKEVNEEISRYLKRKSNQQNKHIVKYLQKTNTPSFFIDKHGDYNEFIGINEFGNPIYYSNQSEKAGRTVKAFPILAGNRYGNFLQGNNIKIGLWEGALPFADHIELKDNIEIKDEFPNFDQETESFYKSYQYRQSHPTHVAGILISRGKDPKSKGVANKATLEAYTWDNDIVEMHYAAKNGLLLSNHSYGVTLLNYNGVLLIDKFLLGAYHGGAIDVDLITYNAHKYQPVMAAGNNREDFRSINKEHWGYDLLTGMSVAKNIVTVANIDDRSVDGAIIVSSTSNFGPTKDFRIKPDIAAPGSNIYSTYAPHDYGRNEIPINNLYGKKSGTSMATPVVTGVFALWQQWAIENLKMPLNSSSLRALMAHTATPIRVYKCKIVPRGPNPMVGWGVINAKKGVEVLQYSTKSKSLLLEGTLNNSEVIEFEIEGDEDFNDVTATLAWTDPPGELDYEGIVNRRYNKALVNDLDMRIIVDQEVYSPWYLNKNFNDFTAKTGDNDVDNIEKIEIEYMQKKNFKVKISHKGTLHDLKQHFSLIISSDKNVSFKIISNSIKSQQAEVYLWPNPSLGILNFENIKDGNFNLSIYSASGKLMFDKNLASAKDIDISHFLPGTYLIKIKTSDLSKSFKIIKK